jgi:hypothetical protein
MLSNEELPFIAKPSDYEIDIGENGRLCLVLKWGQGAVARLPLTQRQAYALMTDISAHFIKINSKKLLSKV